MISGMDVKVFFESSVRIICYQSPTLSAASRKYPHKVCTIENKRLFAMGSPFPLDIVESKIMWLEAVETKQ